MALNWRNGYLAARIGTADEGSSPPSDTRVEPPRARGFLRSGAVDRPWGFVSLAPTLSGSSGYLGSTFLAGSFRMSIGIVIAASADAVSRAMR